MRALLVAICFAAACGPTETRPIAATPTPPPATQIGEPSFDPPRPTLRLPRNFTPTKYVARLELDPSKPDFAGEIAIDGTLDRRSSAIWLSGKHLAVQSAHATDGAEQVPITVTAKGDYLELRPAHALVAGAWQLVLSYRGQIEQNGFNGAFLTKQGADAYVVTQFESTAARQVFPCVDEPDRKTPWQLTLDVPKGQLAISNTPATSATSLDASHDRVAFAATRPLPSYLVAFAVGPWEIVDAGKAKSGLPIRIVVPRGETKKAAYIASIELKIVDFLESWFAIPFPYPKLDVVVVPSLRGGAMENAGMITDDARAALYEHPSQHEKFTVAYVVGHETSHQWFGDLVTAAWWDDIWLNESFATWMEDKITAAIDSSWPSQVMARRFVFLQDELASARKIRQPIENEGDIHNAFDSITYPKGGLVLRMLEHQIGEDKFQTAIRGYVKAHADGNARGADLFAALDQANGSSLAAETSSFFDQPGLPEVAMSLSCDGNSAKIALAQQRFSSSDDAKLPDETWTMPVCVAYEGAKHERRDSCTVLGAKTGELPLDRCPAWFAPAGTYGYNRVKLDTKALEAVRDKAWPQLTPQERVAIYVDLWTAARAGRQPLALALGFFAKLRTGSPGELDAGLGDTSMMGFGGDGLPFSLSGYVPNELRDAARAKVRAYIEPLLRTIGIVAKGDEDYAAESVRIDAFGAATWSHTHVLDAEAKRLAGHWRDLPSASRTLVLTLAANADPAIAEKLRVEMDGEHDPVLRDELLGVIAGLDDPKRHRAMLEKLVADQELASDDLTLAFFAGDAEAQRDDEDYIRAHWDELMRKLPTSENEDFPVALRLEAPFVATCEASRRDDVVKFLQSHFASIPSGDRPTKQAIEGYDRCLARKKLVEPAVRAWLAK
jgi:cytosol alanyl aminopeptidase